MIQSPHHIDFKQMGGTDREEVHDPANAITLCYNCHNKAHRLNRHEYLSPEQLREYKRIDDKREEQYKLLLSVNSLQDSD